MILDLHTHSIKSDDGRAKVGNYCQWIRTRDVPIDGFVLTEHRQFDAASDYRPLEDEYGLRILKGSEVETDYGHVLVFGVNDDMRAAYDALDDKMKAKVEDLICEHSQIYSRGKLGFTFNDEELELIESIVGRTVPFAFTGDYDTMRKAKY